MGHDDDMPMLTHEEVKNHLDTLRPKGPPWVVMIVLSMATLLLALVLNAVFQQNQDIKSIQACRASISSEAIVAQGNVVELFAKASTTADPVARQAYTDQIRASATTLDNAQARYKIINKLCH